MTGNGKDFQPFQRPRIFVIARPGWEPRNKFKKRNDETINKTSRPTDGMPDRVRMTLLR